MSRDGDNHLQVLRSVVPHNALGRVLSDYCPDVVVGSSIDRPSWRRTRALCRRAGVPAILYVRELPALRHLEADGAGADLVLANAPSLCEGARSLGYSCVYVPSVVNTETTHGPTTRQVALCVNPVESHGVDTVIRMAERLPWLPFVLQQSWSLSAAALRDLRATSLRLGNLEVRPPQPPGPELYADARVLLVPHRVDNRPRVIREVQANGIPVIASDIATLADLVGAGGVLLPTDDIDSWCSALERMWLDSQWYESLCHEALARSQDPTNDATVIARSFVAAVNSVALSLGRQPPSA